MAPGVGIVADLTNAGISVARGNYTDASLSMAAAIPIVGAAAGAGKIAHKASKFARGASQASRGAFKGSGTAFRYMTGGELTAIQKTGLLRGGRPGKVFFTKDIFKSSLKAQQRLSLPKSPTLRVEFEILNDPALLRKGTKVQPAFGMPGKGAEFMTVDPVKVRLINWQPLR